MRFLIVLSCLFLCFCKINADVSQNLPKYRPTVCLNMIVKNERDVIERCLQSVLGIIDYWIIVDTGSTDGTQEIIRNFMKNHTLKGELHERPWHNFSHNRNEALQLAKDKADYLFFIDADEYLVFEKEFRMPQLEKDYYYILVSHSGSKYGKTQLIKSSLNWQWIGVLHEYLSAPDAKTSAVIENVATIYTTEGVRSRDPMKYHKDAEILEAALTEDPDNERYVFYLAQSYRDARQYDLALEKYAKRISMGGWNEEIFYSMLQIAAIKEVLQKPCAEVIESYHKAFAYRPSRLEPLYRIANLYRKQGNFDKGYKILQIAESVPRTKDMLFVEQWIYDYGILMEQSICAYWIGKYEESQKLSLQLLQNDHLPLNVRECVERNLGFANAKLAEFAIKH